MHIPMQHDHAAGPASKQQAEGTARKEGSVTNVIMPLIVYRTKFVFMKSNKLNIACSFFNFRANTELKTSHMPVTTLLVAAGLQWQFSLPIQGPHPYYIYF